MRKIGTPLLVIGVAALVLSGCDGIGDGNRPEYIEILQGEDGILEVTECTRPQLSVQAFFSDGSSGNFTARASWRSTDESVVRIGDGDIEIPGRDTFVPRGQLVAVAPGTASVYANLVSLEARLDIVVNELGEITVDPAESTTAVGSTRPINVVSEIDGEEVRLTGLTQWTIESDDETVVAEDVATIENITLSGITNGVLTGEGVGDVTAVGTLDFCERSTAPATVQVAVPQAIELRREYEESTQLVSGTTEFMYPFALFENGDEQDLDGQVIFSSSDEEVVIVGAFGTAPSLILAGIAGGPADVTATFGADEPEEGEEVDLSTGITSAPLQVTVVDATLTSLDITPDAPTVMFGESLDFEATGTFDSGAFTQSITRSVGWVTDDDEVAIFGNTFLTANRFFPALNEAGQSIVTATYTNEDDTVVQATETVTIEPQVDEEEDEDDSSDETGLNPGRF